MNISLPPVLMVDDEQEILAGAATILKDAVPNLVLTVNESGKVLPLLEKQEMAVIILDLSMPGITGQELLRRIRYEYPQVPVVIMTASDTVEMAVSCMKLGAFDYLVKPVEKSRLVASVTRALEVHRLRSEVSSLKRHLLSGELRHAAAFAPIVTRSRKMEALFHYLESVAGSDQPVLLTGETGVGKELFARAIHAVSGKAGEFVALNIAGLDDQMFSDTLFGHRKGAYTGAKEVRVGLIARASGGTLFLDEIGDLNGTSQVKLLRLLQENEYYPLGSDVAKRSTARIVVATNRELHGMISSGEFRNDLYYRLCTHSCHIPPLRERAEDVPILFEHFLAEAAAALQKGKPAYPDGLVGRLAAYPFPGNVRELRAMVRDAVALQKSPFLSPASFRDKLGQGAPGVGTSPSPPSPVDSKQMQVIFDSFPTLNEAENHLIGQAMAIAEGNQGTAASLLGITRQALNNRLVRKRRAE